MAASKKDKNETPADAEGTDTETTETTASAAKGQPRPTAAVDVIDYADVADEADLAAVAGVRASKWSNLLDKLYDDTVMENSPVPRDDEGNLRYVRLGTFNNPGGARTQVKAFEDKGLDTTYDFKTVVKGNQSFLWARVKFISDEAEAETAASEG
jgi:cell division septation protein DedD